MAIEKYAHDQVRLAWQISRSIKVTNYPYKALDVVGEHRNESLCKGVAEHELRADHENLGGVFSA